jgi:NAD(P)-dependent dehydrogenase (short-subunit alcohol dehydrogenase family)
LFARVDPNRITILVNNAGIGSSADPRPVIDFNDAFWERSLWVNLTIPYLLTRRVLPGMIERHAGRIINIASIVGKTGTLHSAAYVASKHGLLGLTRAVATDVVREGITVNAICPGPVATLVNDKRIEYDAARLGRTFQEHEALMTPMGGRLTPDEIAPLAVYLASAEARGVTGQAFNIDGGSLMV